MNLNLPYKEVEEITDNIMYTSFKKTFKILSLWREKAGKSANIQEIIKALRSMNKNLIADQLKS